MVNSVLRMVRLALMAAVCLGLASGCRHARPEGPPRAEVLSSVYPEQPFLMLYRTPAHSGPDAPIITGIEFAIWSDGTYLVPTSSHSLEKPYLLGKLSAEDMRLMLIGFDGFAAEMEREKRGEEPVPLDFGATYMVFRTPSRTITNVKAVLTPIEMVRQIVSGLPKDRLTPADFTGRMPESWKADTPIP